ncbi:Tyrosine-protein phosphatase cdcA [Diplonema papillatum]|nr:Tyrosine-protein phosphatase cdcA [Diplonema papillatum]
MSTAVEHVPPRKQPGEKAAAQAASPRPTSAAKLPVARSGLTMGGQASWRKKKRAPAMSLTSLHLDGELPPFFTFVVEAKLAACGDFDPDKVNDQLRNLAKQQIGGVISLTENCVEKDMFQTSSMKLLHLPTRDLTPPSKSDLLRGVDFIDKVNRENQAVLVHCEKGIGRTGTMLGAYFIVKEGLSAEAAIDRVREKRPGSIHKKVQEESLYELEAELCGCSCLPDE